MKPGEMKGFVASGIVFLVGQAMLFFLKMPVTVQLLYSLLYIGVLFTGLRYQGFVFITRVVIPITIGLIILSIYEISYNFEASKNFLDASFRVENHLNRFFQVMSTLYAICTAFLLWKGLTDHDSLKLALKDEANTIHSLYNYLKYFESTEKNKSVFLLRKLIFEYIENVLVDGRIATNQKNSVVLEKMVDYSGAIEVKDQNDVVALEQIMKEINYLSTYRSKRIACLENRMSPYLLVALMIMSASIMFSFFTKSPVEGGTTLYTMIFVMGTLLSFMFVTMLDISHPFNGFWKIKLDSFDEIRSHLEKDLARTMIVDEGHGVHPDAPQTRVA